MNIGVYCSYNPTQEERTGRISGVKEEHVIRISINVLELLGMVMMTLVIDAMRRNGTKMVGERVMMREYGVSVVKFCKRGNKRNEVTTGFMRILEVLKQIGQWCLLETHVRGGRRGGGTSSRTG